MSSGALCYCYSGTVVLMSSTDSAVRSGQQEAAVALPWPPALPGMGVETRSEGKSIITKRTRKFVLCLKDLCTLDILPEILEAGVYFFKDRRKNEEPRDITAGVVPHYTEKLSGGSV